MSVYAKFLDKNKSKLCESKSKKVSLKKLKRFNESDAYEKELRYETVGDEHIGLNKLEYDDGSVQYLVYGTTFKDEYIDDKEEAEEFFNDMLDELLEKYGYIDVDKQGVTSFELKDGTYIAVNKLIRADGKFEFEVVIGYDNYPPIFRTEEEALEYVDDFLKEQGYTDAEIEELYEKGYLDESCGKRKPKKPFPRKSLKESAKARFLKKAFSKSKLDEADKGEVSSVKKDYKKLVQLLSQASLALGDAWRIRNDLDKFAKKEDVYNTVVYILNNTKELPKIAKKVAFMSNIADGAKTSNFKVLDSENQ